MLATSKELKNIPICFSLLHEQEYNMCLLLKFQTKEKKRRAFSEKNNNSLKLSSTILAYKFINSDSRRQSLKN